MTPEFLAPDEVLELHRLQLERYGGSDGLRDPGLLKSAIARPGSGIGGEFFHPTLFDMAAACLFHIVQNHPFRDGNQRTGLLCALVFLELNGILITSGTSELFELTIGVAEGRRAKPVIADQVRRLTAPHQ